MRALPRVAGTAVLAALCVSLPGTGHGQVTPAPDPRPASPGISLVAATVIPSAAEEVLTLVNDERAKAGCQPVRLDARLTAAATKHSQDMAQTNYFSHVSPSGATFVDRIKAEGYPAPRSENIAAGNATPAATMQQWMNSSGHRGNILDCTAKDMGVGAASNPDSTYRTYWTQDFGRGDGSAAPPAPTSSVPPVPTTTAAPAPTTTAPSTPTTAEQAAPRHRIYRWWTSRTST